MQYLRDLYQTPGIRATVHWGHLKLAGVNHNAHAPQPEGPFVDYDASHGRGSL